MNVHGLYLDSAALLRLALWGEVYQIQLSGCEKTLQWHLCIQAKTDKKNRVEVNSA